MKGVWFRKCLRLHDNAALAHAAAAAEADGELVVPFFVLDPHFDRSRVGINRFQFLLESLKCLDTRLRSEHRSRLLVFRGAPEAVLQRLFEGDGRFKLGSLFWERDTEPYARERDARVEALAKQAGVHTAHFSGHTLLDIDSVVAAQGFKPPISMSGVQAMVAAAGPVKEPLPVPRLPPLPADGLEVPDISELYADAPTSRCFPGGERHALARLRAVCADAGYVCGFEKPKTASTGRPGKPWEPSTTGLSPYLKFGCLSPRTAWHEVARCQRGRAHSKPPQSLHGQLLFREMFYVLGACVPNFDKQDGNRMCKEIPWGENPEMLTAWAEGRTGYPFIDALMRQLRETGWMHHLGRHAVACFLTRGDLWQSWTVGRDHFDKMLLDADWAVNNGNWLWLAGVAPFSAPYFRIYDPCPGERSSLNAEQTGEFVRHFVPELKDMPARYIYKPWTAPAAVQKSAGCVIGRDYPAPIVDHKAAREANLARFKAALEGSKSGHMPEKFGAAERDPGPMQSAFARPLAPPSAAAGGRGGERPSGGAKGRGKRPEPHAGAGQAEGGGAAGGDAASQGPPGKGRRRWGPASAAGSGKIWQALGAGAAGAAGASAAAAAEVGRAAGG